MKHAVWTTVTAALIISYGDVSFAQNRNLSAILDSYKQVNCSFPGGNFCGWFNPDGNDVNWTADNAGYDSYYAFLNFNNKDPGSVGRLQSPWLDALPGYTCTLQFRHYIGISGRCRLSLYQRQQWHSPTLIWTSSQASLLQNTPIERSINCTGLRYRIYFIGERLSDRGDLCGITYKGITYNGIALDDIVYHVIPPPTTTATTTTIQTTQNDGTRARAESKTSGLQTSSIAGIIIAVIAVVVVVAAVIIIILIRRHGTEKAWARVSGFFKIRKQPTSEQASQTGADNHGVILNDQHFNQATNNPNADIIAQAVSVYDILDHSTDEDRPYGTLHSHSNAGNAEISQPSDSNPYESLSNRQEERTYESLVVK